MRICCVCVIRIVRYDAIRPNCTVPNEKRDGEKAKEKGNVYVPVLVLLPSAGPMVKQKLLRLLRINATFDGI